MNNEDKDVTVTFLKGSALVLCLTLNFLIHIELAKWEFPIGFGDATLIFWMTIGLYCFLLYKIDQKFS